MQRAPVHLPCAGVPSPACHVAPRALTVVVAAPEIPAVAVAVVGVVAVAAAAASGAAVEDTWAAAGTRDGACTGRTHMGGSRSSKASFPDPSSSAGTRTATHTHTAAATPPSLSAEHVERAKQLKYGKALPEVVTESNMHTA